MLHVTFSLATLIHLGAKSNISRTLDVGNAGASKFPSSPSASLLKGCSIRYSYEPLIFLAINVVVDVQNVAWLCRLSKNADTVQTEETSKTAANKSIFIRGKKRKRKKKVSSDYD